MTNTITKLTDNDVSKYIFDFGDALMKLFPDEYFAFTFSVICSKDETMKDACFRELDTIAEFESLFVGYNTRIFNPAGQDSIGGGCGQLYETQKWFKNRVKTI